MRKTLNYLIPIVLFFYGCGEGSEVDTSSSPKNETIDESGTIEDMASSAPEIQLKGVYVTSTKIPHDKYDYENLFDGNENTYWATMPGAAPDEGIMLYFQEPQNISFLRIKQVSGNEFSEIKRVVIYVNGQNPLHCRVSDQIKIGRQDVRSMYIRIAELQDMERVIDADEYFASSSFDASKSAAISELSLYSNGNRLNLIPPRKIAGNISASSTLSPEISYGVRNLFDSRKEFAWVEGAKGNGENESIFIELKEEVELTALKVFNGYQRSEKHFNANARLKSMTVSNESGETADVILQDIQGEQTVVLSNPLKGKNYTLTIKEVYPGTTYKDLVISELKLVSKDKDIILKDNFTEKIKKDLLRQVQGTILENYIDRRMVNTLEDMEGYERSIILRSDYTFVTYDKNWSEDSYSEELIADGNWEIKELNKDYAKVRVFGKLTRVSKTIDYYAGDSETSHQQIFHDFLTINDAGIKGEKFIPEIKIAVTNAE